MLDKVFCTLNKVRGRGTEELLEIVTLQPNPEWERKISEIISERDEISAADTNIAITKLMEDAYKRESRHIFLPPIPVWFWVGTDENSSEFRKFRRIAFLFSLPQSGVWLELNVGARLCDFVVEEVFCSEGGWDGERYRIYEIDLRPILAEGKTQKMSDFLSFDSGWEEI